MEDFERVEQIVAELAPELKDLARFIHDNPELGKEEKKACRAQVDLLSKYGFEVEVGIPGFETAYKAVYKGKKSGPKIAMLAEYDALPELGHGCGHNLIAMVGVGAGIAMREFADAYGGEIHVFGTPAEENYGGKVSMAKSGVFDGMDVAMMSHPMDTNIDSMNTMGIKAHRIKFFGKTAHAAAAPEEGINALDAVIQFFCLVNALRQQTREDARLHGIITNGGAASNVIPDYAEAEFCVRANKMAYLEELDKKVIACAEAAALATGCRMEYEKADEDFMDTNSNWTLAELNTLQMEKLGVEVNRMHGVTAPGSSDLGDVSYVCPAIQNTFNMFGDGEKAGAHTIAFAERAGTDAAMEAALTYVKGHVLTAIELMKNPDHLKAIKKEFEENTK